MEEPGYSGARTALLGAGARIHPVRVDADGLDVQAGARSAGRARLTYVTPSHQFPLGDGIDADRVFQEATTRGVEVMPLSEYFWGRSRAPNALVLGFGAVRPDVLSKGMERLAAAIDAARAR